MWGSIFYSKRESSPQNSFNKILLNIPLEIECIGFVLRVKESRTILDYITGCATLTLCDLILK